MGSMKYLPFRQHNKSRTPQLNIPRLSETFDTDTLFSSEVGLGGIICAQLFVGTQSKLTKVFGMRTESEGPQAFEDFIRENGAPYALHSNNAKMQTGKSFKSILQKYNICSKHTEPDHPTQTPAEHHIQDVKRTSAKILDWAGAQDYRISLPWSQLVGSPRTKPVSEPPQTSQPFSNTSSINQSIIRIKRPFLQPQNAEDTGLEWQRTRATPLPTGSWQTTSRS
eukprot:1204976-Ditylum_brightwellii.AAC.1